VYQRVDTCKRDYGQSVVRVLFRVLSGFVSGCDLGVVRVLSGG